MEQNTATPQSDWAALGWITHRQPGLMDADAAEDVWIPREITSTPTGNTTFVNYRLIAPGQPWWSSHVPEMQDSEPAPTEPDRIAALEQRVAELEAAMRQLLHGSRFRLVVEPR
jgi:hypothetical protein